MTISHITGLHEGYLGQIIQALSSLESQCAKGMPFRRAFVDQLHIAASFLTKPPLDGWSFV